MALFVLRVAWCISVRSPSCPGDQILQPGNLLVNLAGGFLGDLIMLGFASNHVLLSTYTIFTWKSMNWLSPHISVAYLYSRGMLEPRSKPTAIQHGEIFYQYATNLMLPSYMNFQLQTIANSAEIDYSLKFYKLWWCIWRAFLCCKRDD